VLVQTGLKVVDFAIGTSTLKWCKYSCYDVVFALVENSSAAAVSIGGSKVYLLGIFSLCSYDQLV
jgi:hypothetical protein